MTHPPASTARAPLAFFALTILGFSFWFFMAAPLASHKESYVWLWQMRGGSTLLDFVSQPGTTFRPISQGAMWLVYQYLGFDQVPSDAHRQFMVQLGIWLGYLPGWWLLYRAAASPRVFALMAMVVGGVLFPPYIQLFHPWGLFYVPVVITTGFLVWLAGTPADQSGSARQYAGLVALAVVLALWHPFAAALIVAYLLGLGLEQMLSNKRVSPVALAVPVIMVAALGFLGRHWVGGPGHAIDDKLLGLLMSYKTIEVNLACSALSTLLVLATTASLPIARTWRLGAAVAFVLASGWLIQQGIPVLMLWIGVAALKAVLSGQWRLAGLIGAASLLPLGSGVGAPAYGLFAIMSATAITATGHASIEALLQRVPALLAWVLVIGALALSQAQRHTDIPVLSRLATPLLAEKDRTQQLEQGLAWLQQSPYCHADVDFYENSLGPTLALSNIINREHRPPSQAPDVQEFWGTYRCATGRGNEAPPLVMFTFGHQQIPDGLLLHTEPSRHAGPMYIYLVQRPTS